MLELNWIGLGKRKAVPGRPVTFVVTRDFLDHFDLHSTTDLPGLAELRAAGLLESRVGAGAGGSDAATMAPDDDLTSPDTATAATPGGPSGQRGGGSEKGPENHQGDPGGAPPVLNT